MSARKEQKHQARARRLELEAALRAQARRKRWRAGLAAAATAALALGGAVVVAGNGSTHARQALPISPGEMGPLSALGALRAPSAPGAVGPEGVPVPDGPPLSHDRSGSPGTPVDGIECQGAEQVLFHIHAHLTVFVDGRARRVPYGVGIPGAQVTATPLGPYVAAGNCFYWLHTHASDGIIHIESPVQRTYTLGDFFDIWRQTLTATQLGAVKGPVTALYNGRVFRGNPRDIPLTRHAQIQLDLARPLVAPVVIRFPAGL